jgi:hypothetical protein
MKLGCRFRRDIRPDAQAFDEVRLVTIPRYKQSGISGDECRISVVAQYWRKGRKLHEESIAHDMKDAAAFLGYKYVVASESGAQFYGGEDDFCDQESCSNKATVAFKDLNSQIPMESDLATIASHLKTLLKESQLESLSSEKEKFEPTSALFTQNGRYVLPEKALENLNAYFATKQEVLPKDNKPEATDSFAVLKRWEGSVTAINGNVITAEVVDLDSQIPLKEEIEIEFEDISEEDKSLVEIGAVFYWSVGYSTSIDRTVMRGSVFRFRRLPAWSRSELLRSKTYAKNLKNELFGAN